MNNKNCYFLKLSHISKLTKVITCPRWSTWTCKNVLAFDERISS